MNFVYGPTYQINNKRNTLYMDESKGHYRHNGTLQVLAVFYLEERLTWNAACNFKFFWIAGSLG